MDVKMTMVRGDTASFNMVLDDLGQDLDSAFFSCKDSYDANDFIFQKSLNNGITKVDTGTYAVRIAPEDTEDVPAGRYFYDLEIGVNSDIFTILKGVLEIEQDVTR